jgi:hypothetical protein
MSNLNGELQHNQPELVIASWLTFSGLSDARLSDGPLLEKIHACYLGVNYLLYESLVHQCLVHGTARLYFTANHQPTIRHIMIVHNMPLLPGHNTKVFGQLPSRDVVLHGVLPVEFPGNMIAALTPATFSCIRT